jgi:hypothetical protein
VSLDLHLLAQKRRCNDGNWLYFGHECHEAQRPNGERSQTPYTPHIRSFASISHQCGRLRFLDTSRRDDPVEPSHAFRLRGAQCFIYNESCRIETRTAFKACIQYSLSPPVAIERCCWINANHAENRRLTSNETTDLLHEFSSICREELEELKQF